MWTVGKLLLGWENMDVHAKNNIGRTPSPWVEMNVYAAVVRFLVMRRGEETDSMIDTRWYKFPKVGMSFAPRVGFN